MGCGSSGNVVPAPEGANGHHKATNGNGHHDDDLPTVVLPDTPPKAKPPIAFEIPLDEFDSNRRMSTTPPPHLQRLLQPTQTEISLPDIEEKLAEAEQRRQSILQQRAQSAQKRAQKMMKSFHEMDRLDSEHEPMNQTKVDSMKMDPMKHEPMKMDSMKTNIMKMDSMEMTPGRVEHIDTPGRVEHVNTPGRVEHIDTPGRVEHVDTPGRVEHVNTPGRVEHVDTPGRVEHVNSGKHGTNAVHITPEPGMCEDKHIT